MNCPSRPCSFINHTNKVLRIALPLSYISDLVAIRGIEPPEGISTDTAHETVSDQHRILEPRNRDRTCLLNLVKYSHLVDLSEAYSI